MTTLDNRIIFYFSGQDVTGHAAGMYPYYLRRYNQILPETIFVGNFYYDGSATSLTIDVTDIIASDGYVPKEDDFEGVYSTQNKIVSRYYVRVMWDAEESDYVDSATQWVAKVYSYSNKNLEQYNTFFQPIGSYYNNYISILEQGFSRNQNIDSKLIPHYPMFSDEQSQDENSCPFGLALLVGQNISEITSIFQVEGEAYQEDVEYERYRAITPSGNSFSYISNVGNVGDYRDITPTSDGVLYIGKGEADAIKIYKYPDTADTWIYRRYPSGDRSGETYKYAFAYVDESFQEDFDDVNLDVYDTADLVYTSSLSPNNGATVYNSDNQPYVMTSKKVTITEKFKAAIFDICPKRFYLFWQDRYGSFQCQGFNDYANYSETFTRTEVQDYQNRRRNANIQVQNKWKLNSGWITEELYPYYESIYTSPLLILYDSERDERHTVMVSGDYEEKTYRNQKKMINMTLDLQENKKQNIIY